MAGEGVQIRSSGRVVMLSGAAVAEVAPSLLGALDGRSTVVELAARLGLDLTVATEVVDRLAASGVVQDGQTWEEGPAAAVRDHLAELGLDHVAARKRLAAAAVAVIGTGPVGRLAALHLDEAGVGEVAVVDGTSVAAGDIDAAMAMLCPFEMAIVETGAAGEVAATLNRACLEGGGHVLPYAVSSKEAVVGPLMGPTGAPCHLCAQLRQASHIRHHDAYEAYRGALASRAVDAVEAALLPGQVGIVAGLVSVEALRVVTACMAPITQGAALVADLVTLEIRRENVLAVPNCPACAPEAAAPPQ